MNERHISLKEVFHPYIAPFKSSPLFSMAEERSMEDRRAVALIQNEMKVLHKIYIHFSSEQKNGQRRCNI